MIHVNKIPSNLPESDAFGALVMLTRLLSTGSNGLAEGRGRRGGGASTASTDSTDSYHMNT